MAIQLTNPISQPRMVVPEGQFDAVWFNEIRIIAPAPTAKVNAIVHLTPYSSSNGAQSLKDRKALVVEDIFALAATDPDVAVAMNALLSCLGKLAARKGLI